MSAGIIQLVSHGEQDLFLTRDPQITFFKIVYRRHTNFAIEQIPQYFITTPDFGKKTTCTISKRGDLVGKMHVVLTIPRINPFYLDSVTIDNITKFAWIKKLGYGIIHALEIEIGGKLIDRQYGEWMNIISELFGKNKNDDKMIGNVEELISYTNGKDEYTLYIPLQFWFCRNSGWALPIVCLRYNEVKITMELSTADKCYLLTPTHYMELFNDVVNMKEFEYIEQNVNGVVASGKFISFDPIAKRLYYQKISDNNFRSMTTSLLAYSDITAEIFDNDSNSKYFIRGVDTNCVAIPKVNTNVVMNTPMYEQVTNMKISNCFLLVDYYYIDSDERARFLNKKQDYLIEQVQYIQPQTIHGTNNLVNIDVTEPCKMLVWMVQQNYLLNVNNNDHFNYTDSYRYKNGTLVGKSLVVDETIKLNGIDRVNKRDYKYFNYLQPYGHVSKKLSEGINVYSFGLMPEIEQPSGSCNMSQINDIQMDISVKNIVNINNTGIVKGYAWVYNVLRIIDGLSGVVFIR